MRYYVDNSSYFDTHPYRPVQIASAVRKGGGKNIRKSKKFGWFNQPSVVTFDATPTTLKTVEKAVEKAVGTQWILLKHKNW